jgi:hypothetical protein
MRARIIAVSVLFLSLNFAGSAQRPETRNIVIVTLDGLRWQELFRGADPEIACREKYVTDEPLVRSFLHPSETERRKMLMPFMWKVISAQGQLYGNRNFGNRVNCTNHHLISYPGYSEMLVGFTHRKVSSNRKVENPHRTVLEVIENNDRFRDEVAAFATWDAFPFILRKSKSNIHVNAGTDLAVGRVSRQEELLNQLLASGRPRSDSITFQFAMEYLKRVRPRVTFIGFDGTDKYAHAGRYDEYLRAANGADQMISQLWNWLQAQPDYKDQTTLFVTTDHGRGSGKNNWRKHRLLAAGSRHIWFAVIGPDTPSFGEMKINTTTYQAQVAKTVAAFLGLPYKNEKPVGEVLQTMIAVPQRKGEHKSLFTTR